MSKLEKVPGYIPVRTSTLVADYNLGVDIFLIIDGRPVIYSHANEPLGKDRLDRLHSFKKKKVLIRESDENGYRSYLDSALFATMEDTKSSVADKTQVASSAAESAAEEIINKPQEKAAYLNAQKYFENFGMLLQKHGGSFAEVLNAPYDPNQDHVAHGLQIAALSIFMCDTMGLIKDSNHQTSIITGCFLHDIGLESGNLNRSPDMRQNKIWKEHPKLGVTQLQGQDHIDQQVLRIILEHEEVPNGEGFPNKLNQQNMDPVALVVSLANRFELYVEKKAGDKKAALTEMFTGELGRFDLPILEKLRSVLKTHLR